MTQDHEELAARLARVAHDTVIQWMRNVEMPDGLDAYLSWSDDGTFVLGEYGRFKLNVSVTAIPGPAQIEEQKQHPCSECSTEDPHPWCDCRTDETCKGPCRQRAHDPNVCPNLIYVCEACNSGGHTCPGDGNSIKHGDPDCGQHDEPDWVVATWRYVLLDDRVRLGESEAEVTACNTGVWHADTSDYWHPKPWEHTEVKVQLKHTGEVWLPWPPDSEVEIFMDSARRAAYVLQQSFEGTREVKRCDASVSTSSHVTPGSAFTSPRKQSTFARFRSWSSDGCAR